MLSGFDKYLLIIVCLLGSLMRYIYGYAYEPWTQAPDHLAWELILEEGGFQYSHLIHYPHEGGTILVSLLSRIFELFTPFSSLTIAAFLLDFLVRFCQLKIVDALFNRTTALWFGAWSVLAFPVIIPWATVNFGLHYIASIFPFLLIYFLSREKKIVKDQLISGALLGLSVWFSYINIVLLPIYFGYKLIQREKIADLFYSSVGLLGILTLHFCIRTFSDSGFHLNEHAITAIRGEGLLNNDLHLWTQLRAIPAVLANASLSIPSTSQLMPLWRSIFYGLMLLATFGFFRSFRKQHLNPAVRIILPLLVLFMVIYVISPFYYPNDKGTHVSFRHLTYILPLFSLFIIHGLRHIPRVHSLLLVLFVGIGTWRGLQLFTADPPKQQDLMIKAAGWTIGTKFGHDPRLLEAIIRHHPEQQKLLTQGVSWGISVALFHDLNMPEDRITIEARVDQLEELLDQLTLDKNDLTEGVHFAFSDQVSPKLDPTILIFMPKNNPPN